MGYDRVRRVRGYVTAKGEVKRGNILTVIVAYFEEHGYPPSIAEIAQAVGMSVSGTNYHLGVLQRQGWIVREYGKSRAIRMKEPSDEQD